MQQVPSPTLTAALYPFYNMPLIDGLSAMRDQPLNAALSRTDKYSADCEQCCMNDATLHRLLAEASLY